MKKQRTTIPPDVTAQLLFQNRHRCCICHKPRKAVQIHHIDGNPSNNAPENLAVLCVDHHSQVSSRQGFGKDYSQREVTLFKESWERQCMAWHANSDDAEGSNEEEDEQPIHEEYSDSILPIDVHDEYSFELDEGDEIVIGVTSDEPLDMMIMKTREYKRSALEGRVLREWESQYEIKTSYPVPSDGWYSVVICNFSDEDARVRVDITTWPNSDE